MGPTCQIWQWVVTVKMLSVLLIWYAGILCCAAIGCNGSLGLDKFIFHSAVHSGKLNTGMTLKALD